MSKIKHEPLSRRSLSVIVATAIFILAFSLRFYRLGAHDFWYDEIYTVWYAVYPWNNWNAPLYWIVLHFWVKVFGFSEFSLRFLPMLFSFLATGVVFLLGKELFNKKTALLATLLTALSPFHLWYAQEARDYGMVVFFGTLASYILFISLKKGSFKKWLAFVLVSFVGVYTNYFYLFLLLAQFLYILYLSRFRMRKIHLLFLLVVGAFSFYVPRFMSKFLYVSKGFWVPRPDWQSMSTTLQNYMLGYNGTTFLYTLSSCVALASFVHLLAIARKKKDMQRNIAFCAFLFMAPIASVFLFSQLFFSVYLTRGLLLFSPYFYLLVAYAVMEWRAEVRVVVIAILVGILSCGAHLYFKDHLYPPFQYHIGAYIKKPIRPIVAFLNNHVGKDDLIAWTNESAQPGVDFYGNFQDRGFRVCFLFLPQILDPSWQRPVKESDTTIPADKVRKLEFKKLWVISADWGRTGMLDENSVAVKRCLDDDLKLTAAREIEGVWIYCYEKKQD